MRKSEVRLLVHSPPSQFPNCVLTQASLATLCTPHSLSCQRGMAIKPAGVILFCATNYIQTSELQTINVCHFGEIQECSKSQRFLGITESEEIYRMPQKEKKLFLK